MTCGARRLFIASIAFIACSSAFALDMLTDPLGDCKRVEKPRERAKPAPILIRALKPSAAPAPARAASSPGKLRKRPKKQADAPVEYEYECPPLQFPKLTASLPPAADVPAAPPALPIPLAETPTLAPPCACLSEVPIGDGGWPPPLFEGVSVIFTGNLPPSRGPPDYHVSTPVPEPSTSLLASLGLLLLVWRVKHA